MNMQTDTPIENAQPSDAVKALEALQAVERKYFGSAALEAGQVYISTAMEACHANNIDAVLNFDAAEEFPAGYGLAVIPLTERVDGQGNVTKGMAIAAIPDFETIAADADGSSWVQKQITDAMLRQVSTAAKSKDGQLTSIPFKVADFATSSRSSGLAGFNHVGALFVKALKTKGLKLMSKALLRQILASAAFAEQQYPRLPQENWVAVLSSMVSHAAKDGIDVSGLKHWLSTRDTETVDMADVDLTDIDAMV